MKSEFGTVEAMLDWDRSHDWIVTRYFRNRMELIVQFERANPSVAELMAVRKCLPRFQHMAPAAVRADIGNSGRLELGEFDGLEARWLLETLKRAGLSVTSKNASSVGYLPFDRTTNMALLVENDEEAKALAEQMIMAGIPVTDVEVD